jgi:hypothetical protein
MRRLVGARPRPSCRRQPRDVHRADRPRAAHGAVGRRGPVEAFASARRTFLALLEDEVTATQTYEGQFGTQTFAWARGAGVFGPELEAPADADGQTRVLAFLGRQA